jgi:hypothetical protein
MQFSPFSRHLIPVRSKYPPQQPVLKHSLCSPLMSETKFHTHTEPQAKLSNNTLTYRYVYTVFFFSPYSRRESVFSSLVTVLTIHPTDTIVMGVGMNHVFCTYLYHVHFGRCSSFMN